jgi:hypothetical protein
MEIGERTFSRLEMMYSPLSSAFQLLYKHTKSRHGTGFAFEKTSWIAELQVQAANDFWNDERIRH